MIKPNTTPYAALDLRQQIYMECESMARYALAKGKLVPATIIKNIEAFADGLPMVDGHNATLQIHRDLDITALLDAHTVLAHLIEPATPKTVLLLYVEQQTATVFNFLGPVALVRQLMLAAALSLFVFIGLMASPFINSTQLAADVLSTDGVEQLARLTFYISAAGLGASFAGLYIVKGFISKGTYDPCYQASYWIRFLLGIIAGLLLSVLLSEHSLQADGLLSQGIIRPLLAILGGFSADLLYTFLNRMVEAFQSLFEGNMQNMADAKTQEAKAKLAGQEIERRMKLVQDLMQMQRQMGQETDPAQLKQQIDEILKNLMHAK